MGTRGTIGVHIDGEDKFAYNHFDSYPEELGVNVLANVTAMMGDWGLEKIKIQARRLTLVDGEIPPTPEQLVSLAEFTVVRVGDQTGTDWYGVLRELQGKLTDYLTVGYMEGANNFIKESLFCEWGYILNLDEGVLEVYKGFQDIPHTKGRYAVADVEENNIGSKYYPCALIVTFSLDDLPTIAEFEVAINRAGFDTEEEMVRSRVDDYGEITRDEATELYGIKNFDVVLDALKEDGYLLVADDAELPNLFTLA